MAAIDQAEPVGLLRALRAVGIGLARALPVILLLVAWELFARSGAVTMFVLPPLSAVLARIWENAVGGELWINTAVTLYRAIVGFLIATVGGIVLGLAMSRSALARWFFDPVAGSL